MPESFSGPIERYLERYRPLLISRSPLDLASNAFWISNYGRPISAADLRPYITAVTTRELGRSINPHLFRKIVATELAIRDPEHVCTAQPLLGHASYQTTQQAYNLSRTIDAADRYHAVVREIRGESKVRPRCTKQNKIDKQCVDVPSDDVDLAG